MSQRIPPPRGGSPGGRRDATDVRHDLWGPTLMRSLVALAFGAVTIFWQEPTRDDAPLATGLFMVGTGLAWWYLYVRIKSREDTDPDALRSVLSGAGFLYLLGGVLVAWVSREEWIFVLLSAVILGLAGFLELALGLRFRKRFPLGRDWTLCGLITVLAGVGMVLVETLGAKAELGVIGGAAVIIGVTQFIAALSLRHDAGKVDGPPPGGAPGANRVD